MPLMALSAEQEFAWKGRTRLRAHVSIDNYYRVIYICNLNLQFCNCTQAVHTSVFIDLHFCTLTGEQ